MDSDCGRCDAENPCPGCNASLDDPMHQRGAWARWVADSRAGGGDFWRSALALHTLTQPEAGVGEIDESSPVFAGLRALWLGNLVAIAPSNQGGSVDLATALDPGVAWIDAPEPSSAGGASSDAADGGAGSKPPTPRYPRVGLVPWSDPDPHGSAVDDEADKAPPPLSRPFDNSGAKPKALFLCCCWPMSIDWVVERSDTNGMLAPNDYKLTVTLRWEWSEGDVPGPCRLEWLELVRGDTGRTDVDTGEPLHKPGVWSEVGSARVKFDPNAADASSFAENFDSQLRSGAECPGSGSATLIDRASFGPVFLGPQYYDFCIRLVGPCSYPRKLRLRIFNSGIGLVQAANPDPPRFWTRDAAKGLVKRSSRFAE